MNILVNILDRFRLDGKVALVTGANRGLGAALAMGLAEAGADVVGVNRSSDPGATAEVVTDLGRRYHHIQVDLESSGKADLQRVIAETVAQMGKLDILVNNAGVIRRTAALDHSEADWDTVMQVNLKSVFLLSQAAAQAMVPRGGGKIIQIGSVLSFQGGVLVPSYAAAKHALVGLTRSLANEWAGRGINVNAIAPGYFSTDNTQPIRQDDERSRAILDRVPAGRWGDPDDLKGALVFLASDAANFVHGATLAVDGGWLSR